MIPHKGYLIETFANTVKTSNGFGGYIESHEWRTRIIDAATGTITVLPPGSSTQSAMMEINALTDPSGKTKERDCLASVIKATNAEIADIEENIKYETKALARLTEQLERLKSEYAALGGSNE